MRNRDATRKALSKPAAFVMLIEGLTLKTELTAERLRELLHYDPETGLFSWLVHRRRHKAGAIAGCIRNDGYCRITIDGIGYFAHRIAWLYAYREAPSAQIDHIDGDRANNAISNLRQASNSENCQNRAIRSDSSTGMPGVGWQKKHGKYQAKIGINGKRHSLGLFDTAKDANEAYLKAKSQLHNFQPAHRATNHQRQAESHT